MTSLPGYLFKKRIIIIKKSDQDNKGSFRTLLFPRLSYF